jgi:protein-S-isoprenylcysteine O-methyltransferase Ste14
MFIVARTLVYGSIFVAFLLVFLPARVLAWSGVPSPPAIGGAQVAGMVIAAAGSVLTVWCAVAFSVLGKGTPAPFDPPRRLVARGPYRFIRNPMYLGAGVALLGAALFYRSAALAAYAAAFLVAFHVFVVAYEEPTLTRKFGADYEDYLRRVGRWWPKRG